jgi:hypothetical protein
VRLGAVELVFRAIASVERPPEEAPRTGLWAKLKGLLRIVMPPVE